MDWDERSSAGRYVRENCKPLARCIIQTENEDHRQLIDLISRMLEYDPSSRIKLSEALEHPFFWKLPSELRIHKHEAKLKAGHQPCGDNLSCRSNSIRRSSGSACSDRSSASSVSSHSTHTSEHRNHNHHHYQHYSDRGNFGSRRSHNLAIGNGSSQRNNELNHTSSHGLSSFY